MGPTLLRSLAVPDQEHALAFGSVMNLIGPFHPNSAEGFTCEEAAARLGCQAGTVKSRVSRARNFLAGRLDTASTPP